MVRYAAVENHIGENYVAEVNDDEDIELIQEICETCFDADFVLDIFDTKEEAEQYLR